MSVEARVKRIFELVIEERKKQIGKWEGRPAPPTIWFVVVLLFEFAKLMHMLLKRAAFCIITDYEEDCLVPVMAVCLLWLEKVEKKAKCAIKANTIR